MTTRRAILLATVGFCSSLVTAAAPPPTKPASRPTNVWTQTEHGRLILRPFDTAPYPHASRAQGFKSSAGTFSAAEHYSDSTVGIFVPKGFKPADATDFVVYFHGHRNRVDNVISHFKLEDEMTRSGVNAILIVPQGPLDAPDSGDGKLELDDGGFARFTADVTRYLMAEGVVKTDRIGSVALAAHSGGYKVTASILHRGGLTDHVHDVLLLDATYGNLEWFAEYAKARPDGRIVSFHTKHLDDENAALAAQLDKAGVRHRDVAEADASAAAFEPRGVTFVSTTLSHNDVPTAKHYLATTLATSKLGRIAGR